ncbi:MAG: sulfoxide reductase heme-binding subunit YedZ [Deltaproteobacteria bacterium]|nr:sulfoxide reductase heme-binding subunit YedZ [Deltaproteobacteria bacterium]
MALIARAAMLGLGANPIEYLTHRSGDWALRLLLLTLAVTPARQRLDWAWAAPLRRTFGLAAFAYAMLHFTTYFALDQFFDLAAIAEDVLERRHITAGFAAFLCILPLVITSTRGWIRRLGQRWIRLHRLAYLGAIFAVLHYLWLTKADLLAPLLHAALLAGLLATRLAWRSRTRGES